MDLFFWELARASGLAAYAALCIAVLTGIAPRTQLLSFLASNRAVRALHDWTPWIVIPAALTHVVALLLDATAKVGVLDVFVPFLMSYDGAWQWFHRLSYVGFVTLFLHAQLSGTDLTSPLISVPTWAAAIAIGYYALERAGKALQPARVRT
ncbi:MAG: hypothetical protein E6J09_08375 [Chloroflexi bacterium]|nr:MAG: hypothetical protein E6J09_08375 [Chloroflexota bacterium]